MEIVLFWTHLNAYDRCILCIFAICISGMPSRSYSILSLTSWRGLQVSPGTESSSPQKVMAVNITDKQCCELGEVNKRAAVTPDIDSLLDSLMD